MPKKTETKTAATEKPARKPRDPVTVNGNEYANFSAAWHELGLPPGKLGPTRAKLKKDGAVKFVDEKGDEYEFALVK